MIMSTNTIKKSASRTNRPVVAVATASVNIQRDARGRFASPTKSVVVKASKSTKATAPSVPTQAKSSFIQSVTVNPDNTISVVMTRNPKTVYNYKATKRGLERVISVIQRGGSLGTVYNTYLKGREVSRTIFAK